MIIVIANIYIVLTTHQALNVLTTLLVYVNVFDLHDNPRRCVSHFIIFILQMRKLRQGNIFKKYLFIYFLYSFGCIES